MLRDLRPALVITRREIRDQFRDWRIIFPIIVLTLFFPALMNFVAEQLLEFMQEYEAPIIGDRLVPFLLMAVGFFPLSVSLVIALESFVGEKERRSIEPLLSSPLTDFQIYIGKLIAVMVPPLLASFLGISVYLLGVYRQLGWSPGSTLLTQVLLLTFVQALLMVSGAVVISSQTTSTRAANLLASFIIVPMALLLIMETGMMFWADYNLLWWFILGQAILAGLLVRTGIAHFNREELLGRELDTLNLRWSWHVFIKTFKGDARSPLGWYRDVFATTLKRTRLAVGITAVLLIGAFALGIAYSQIYALPLPEIGLDSLQNLDTLPTETEIPGLGLPSIQFFSLPGVFAIWKHNIATILGATFMSIFTFGVLSTLIIALPFAIIGYVTGVAASAGWPLLLLVAATILPHGIVEIPAILLAGAATLRLGATLVTPAPGYTIGEALVRAFGDWARLMVALILPLFLIAAVLEIYVTPWVLLQLLG